MLAAGAACASDARSPDHEAADVRHAEAWFAVKAADCAGLLPAVAVAATKLGATAPTPHVLAAGPAWCVFAPEAKGGATRSDSVAQAVSTATGAPAVAFWVTASAWSYNIFDQGRSVYAMESHYGAPILIGDESKGAAIVGLPAGALYGYLSSAHQPDMADVLAGRIGAARPLPGTPLAALPTAPAPDPSQYDPKLHPPSPRLEAGSWAVLPPLGVVLVREVTGDGNYVLVDDDRTFPIPIERAGGLGMRRLASSEDADQALYTVERGADVEHARDYSAERAQAWLDTLKNGSLLGIAKTYAEICTVQAERKLYAVEQGLLTTSREWLSEEISTVQNKTHDAVEAQLVDECE